MTIRQICEQSIRRARRWHKGDIHSWSVLEWAGAMCGEAGECANAAKKLKRIEDNILSINEGERHIIDLDVARTVVAREVCDVILYAVLVAAAVNVEGKELQALLKDVFNRKSVEYDFPERL